MSRKIIEDRRSGFPWVLEFEELPVTADERAIAALLTEILQAAQNQAWDALRLLYRTKTSRGWEIPGRNHFIEELRRYRDQFRKIEFQNILIRIPEANDKASIAYLRIIHLNGSLRPRISQRFFHAIQDGGAWYVLYDEPKDSIV